MYQNFNILPAAPYKNRILRLRTILREYNLDGFLIPRTDLYQNEYIEACDARLEWITGFTGSAGLCLVTQKSAFVFVDGRYETQISKEIDTSLFTVLQSSKISFKDWFQLNCNKKTIGYDPWLHSVSEIANLTSSSYTKANIKQCTNLVDLIWTEKPRRVDLSVSIHDQKFSGVSSQIKRKAISNAITKKKIDAVILTKPDSICWLLNIRGKDIIHTPTIQCLAIIKKNSEVKLFIRNKNLPANVVSFLGDGVEVFDQDSFPNYILGLKDQDIQIDPSFCPIAVYDLLRSCNKTIFQEADPCLLPKAIKNSTEIKGCKEAHIVDAASFIRFLHWLDSKKETKNLNEILVTRKLEEFRISSGLLEEIAFDTICGFGSNGAIVHYRVTEKTNKKIDNNNLLLIDSGGQYKMGTTDLTRTIAMGKPTQKMIDIFTLVLKGMITVSNLKWPKGLSGQFIDSFARQSLWSRGLDYEHGTGHGIGSYLSVHEGPHGLTRKNSIPLEAGMLTSNEPGYYEVGEFGIRIENILLIKKIKREPHTNHQMLGFETLTLVPIDKKLINENLLSAEEKNWLNSYHKLVFKKIAPLLDSKIRNWLRDECSAI